MQTSNICGSLYSENHFKYVQWHIHVNVHNFIPFGFFWVTTCIHTIHTISTSNSLTEIKRNTIYKRPVFIYQYIYKQNTSFDLLQKHLHINFMLFINSLSKESIIATSTLILYKNSTTMKHDKLQMIFWSTKLEKRTYIKANIKKSVSIFDSSCIYSCTIQCMLESN